jgi:hypothetical protein
VPFCKLSLYLWLFVFCQHRLGCYSFATSTAFEWAMLAIISLSCLAMTFEGPKLDDSSTLGHVLYYADLVFTAAFTLVSRA